LLIFNPFKRVITLTEHDLTLLTYCVIVTL
jgi:hypothetical protein